MNTDFENMVALYILAVAEEKVGDKERAAQLWEKILSAWDVIEAVAETMPGGLFETEMP